MFFFFFFWYDYIQLLLLLFLPENYAFGKYCPGVSLQWRKILLGARKKETFFFFL